ncbi:MAG: TIGR02757 family protein [Muribaculaceae bacterium]|nr:TIGR02757 family protein [Muribaculaceae bacterium]
MTQALSPTELKALLDREAQRICVPEFAQSDPVQFPRRFSNLQDIEIVSFLAATIAWGNRKMICNNCNKMLDIMQHDPHHYVLEGAYEDLDDGLNIHRTFFARNLKYALRGLRAIYTRHGSLNDFAAHHHVGASETPSWQLVEHMQGEFAAANGGNMDSRTLPTHLEATALKRINMALRWLVRDDGIVDMGVWNAIKPSQLFIPLDVHVGNTARALGLTQRRANDRKTVVEITSALRAMRPEDPVFYDYALFGLGIESK